VYSASLQLQNGASHSTMVAHILSDRSAMKATSRMPSRRVPHQRRARATVEAILDAAIRILKREGVAAITTNRVAEIAGVSVGSIYQYFPDKRAIFIALHRRHVEEIDRHMQRTLIAQAAAPLEALLESMVAAMVEAHSADPQLHELLSTQVPHRGDGTQEFAQRMQGVFRLVIAARAQELRPRRQPERLAFVLAHMLDALGHGAVQRRPPELTLAEAKQETVRAMLAYLHA
jgi:AcrR family transcriptional regulator